ncbi:MAG: SAF domain-containing protein [Mycobacteriales bacterium]
MSSSAVEAPRSPAASRLAAPSWRDGRLVLGVLLVLVSVLVGAKVLAGADAAQQVWVAARDLAPGTVLGADDLHPGRVRLFGASERYLAGGKPVGYVVQRGVSAGELLPAGALAPPGALVARRDVTVPVPAGHLPPDLTRGDQVDVYVTPDDKAARRVGSTVPLSPRLVLRAVTVARVVRSSGLGSSGQDQPVVLSVDPADVLTLVQAMGEGHLDLVRVPRSQQQPLVAASPAS